MFPQVSKISSWSSDVVTCLGSLGTCLFDAHCDLPLAAAAVVMCLGSLGRCLFDAHCDLPLAAAQRRLSLVANSDTASATVVRGVVRGAVMSACVRMCATTDVVLPGHRDLLQPPTCVSGQGHRFQQNCQCEPPVCCAVWCDRPGCFWYTICYCTGS